MNENPQTPEEVGQWLRDHGGPLRSEGPDANGIVTQYAADGSYLRQQALPGGNTRVLEVKPAAPAVPGGSGAPPATSAPRGAGMTQAELEALIAKLGPLGAGDFREETKTEEVPNPNFDAIKDPRPKVQATVTYRTWVKPGTNQRITVKVNSDGSYTKTFDGPDPTINAAKPSEAGQTAGFEGTPLPGGGFDNSRPRWVVRGPGGNIISSEEATGAKRTEWEEQQQRARNGGKTDKELKDEKEKADATARTNQPKDVREAIRGKDGKAYIKVTTTNPATGKAETYYENESGQRVPPPDDVKAIKPLPPDAPKLDLTNATTARTSFMALMAYVDNLKRSGQMTPEDAKEHLVIPHAQAKDLIDQEATATTQANTLRDDRLAQNRDLEGRRANRAREAGTMFSNASQAAGAPGTVRGDLTPGYMQLQARMAQASGANEMQPEIDIPGAITIKPPTAPAITPAAVAPSGVAAGPLLRPNQPVGAAQASAVAAQAQTAAAGAPPTAGEPGGPTLAPGPVAPTPAAIAPAPPYPAGLPPQAQGPYPSVNPVTGEPTGLTPPGQGAADGNERPDDVLTVYNPQSMQTITITRAKFMEFPPEARAQVVVQNAVPATMPAAAPVNMKPEEAPLPLLPHEPGFVPVNPPAGAPGNNPNVPVGQAPPQQQVGAVASYQPPTSMYDRDEQFMAEGYTAEEIEEARRRVLARYAGMGAA